MPFTQEISVIMNGPKFKLIQFSQMTCKDQLIGKQVANHLCMYGCMYVSFRQGSSLLWTHTLRSLYSRPIALTQEGRSQVDDVCECVRD